MKSMILSALLTLAIGHSASACIDLDRAKEIGSAYINQKYDMGNDQETLGEYSLMMGMVSLMEFSAKNQVYNSSLKDATYSEVKAYVEVTCDGVASSVITGLEDQIDSATAPEDDRD